MHPDDNCTWDRLHMEGKHRAKEVDQGDGEEVEESIAGMLHVVGVADVSLVRLVDVCLGCVPHSCQGEQIGKDTKEEETTAG